LSWDGFLKSLETDGGKLFVTISMIVFVLFVCMVLLLFKVQIQETGRNQLATFFGLLAGVLIVYLKPSGPAK